MLPFFFRHYDRWVDRYFIYDDGSEDGTLEILRAHPRVEVRAQPRLGDPQSRIESTRRLLNAIWKGSRGLADWVVVTDLDEHLHHPRIHSYLQRCADQGVTVIPGLGFEMISRGRLPARAERPLFRTFPRGAPSRFYSKASIFNPDAIGESNFSVGRHEAGFTGRVAMPRSLELLLLHFHYIDFARVAARHALYATRQLPKDLSNKWGVQYGWSDAELRTKWAEMERLAFDLWRTPWQLRLHPGQGKWSTFPGPVASPHQMACAMLVRRPAGYPGLSFLPVRVS